MIFESRSRNKHLDLVPDDEESRTLKSKKVKQSTVVTTSTPSTGLTISFDEKSSKPP